MRRLATVLLAAGTAFAAGPADPRIAVGDVSGSGGEWQEGAAVVGATPVQVQAWLTDYAKWPARFPDIVWSEVRGDDERGRHIVRFRSRIADETLTVHEAVAPGLLVFEGWAPNVYTQGRIHLLDAGPGRTHVIMQSMTHVYGFWRIFATRKLKRDRAQRIIRSHLAALLTLGELMQTQKRP